MMGWVGGARVRSRRKSTQSIKQHIWGQFELLIR